MSRQQGFLAWIEAIACPSIARRSAPSAAGIGDRDPARSHGDHLRLTRSRQNPSINAQTVDPAGFTQASQVTLGDRCARPLRFASIYKENLRLWEANQ